MSTVLWGGIQAMMPVSFETQDFQTQGYEPTAEILHALFPEYHRSPEELRHWDEAFDRSKYVLKRYSVLESSGKVVAFGEYRHTPGMYHPRKFWMSINVHPAWQQRGVGVALYDRIMKELGELQAITVRTQANEDESPSISFLEKRGFREKMRDWESHLPVQEFDFSRLPGYFEKVSSRGIAFSTLAEESGCDPECHQKLCELLMAVSADMPSEDLFTPISFEEFMKLVVENPRCLPEGFFIARDGERYVGLSNVFRSELEPQDLYQQDTGVLREYRGRGIAMALKLGVIDFAKRYGARVIKTWNDSTNTAMLAINHKLASSDMWAGYGSRRSLDGIAITRRDLMDRETTVLQLKKLVSDFRDERDWRKYDTPKNLAISISVEAAELLELFQWKKDHEIDRMIQDPDKKSDVSDELADVIIYCLGLSDTLNIDISKALKRKLDKNSRKYPMLKAEVPT